MSDEWYALSNGHQGVTHVHYSPSESRGPLALAVTAGVSLVAVSITLVAIAVTGFRTQHQFARSQVGAYFLSLVLSDLLQATGSVMNAKWVVTQRVSMGHFCTAQAALKQTGNVGTALWSLVIAVHTFSLLFLRRRIGNIIFYCILIGVWGFIGFVVMIGPVFLQQRSLGPFWGVSGFWCWITNSYHVEQFTNEYLFMFLTAGLSAVLYSLIFLRLRGNLYRSGWNLRFRCVHAPWTQSEDEDSQLSAVGKQMLWYPVAYTLLIVPIAVCRWRFIFGHTVPYGATITADAIFMLSGFVNAILYSTTRKIVSISTLLPFSRFILIVSSRRDHRSRGGATEASLDEMRFSLPVVSRGVLKTVPDRTPRDLQEPLDMSEPRRGSEFPSYFRTRLKNGQSPPWSTKSDSESGHSDVGDVNAVDVYTPPKETPGLSPSHGVSPHTGPSFSPLVAAPCVQPHYYSVHADTSYAVTEVDVEPLDAYAQPQGLSESPPTTDGAPSLHHKRFSGWSFPSVPGTPAPHDADSVYTDLEEMRFASPSPERVFHNINSPSRSHSTTDLPSAPWHTRSYVLE